MSKEKLCSDFDMEDGVCGMCKNCQFNKMSAKLTKKLTPHPTHSFRASPKVWNELKKQKLKSGWSWDRFIENVNKLVENKSY